MKPILLPALRRLWRDSATIQLGVDPRYATTLQFPEPRTARVLDLLDGTRTAHRVACEAHRLGMPQPQTLRMIQHLYATGLLADLKALAPTDLPEGTRRRLDAEIGALSLRDRPGGRTPAEIIRRRRRASVLISGRGRMAAAVAALLAAAGVGRMEIDLPGSVTRDDIAVGGMASEDLGRPRTSAAADAVRRAAPDVDLRPLRGARPDLAILVGAPRPDPVTALRYARRRCPHLPVWLRDGVVVLGPLVLPGRTTCLDCVNLHRQGRDPHWPVLAAQLATSPHHNEPAEAALVGFGAGLAATHALCHIDGGMPGTVGGTVELTPVGQVRRRSWPPHPRCGCLRR
ncbi:MAG TPA: hypothetical protein VFZ32_17375 [Micromonosporaceae bacterium]